MVFKILQIRTMAKEAKENPGKFAGGQVGDFFVDVLIVPTIIAFLFLALLFILSFTSILGGPYLFFKIIFFLTLALVLFVSYLLLKIYRFIKSVTKNVVESTIKVDSKIIE